MNGHARTVYSTLSRGYDFVYFFIQSCTTLCCLFWRWCTDPFPMLSQLLLTIVHIFLYVGSWLVNLPTMASLCDCRLQRIISLVFVPVWLFHFFSGSFQAKSMYSNPTISCVNRMAGTLECYLSQTCIHAILDSNSICSARVLHFSAFI